MFNLYVIKFINFKIEPTYNLLQNTVFPLALYHSEFFARLNTSKQKEVCTMKTLYCDLHSHTINSDGTASIEELILQAKAANISALAITDHDIYDERIEEIKKTENNFTLVTGAEFSTKYISPTRESITVHVIGLFFDYKNNEIQKMFRESRSNQEAYVKAILSTLKKNGMEITYEEVLKSNPGRKIIGRIPIAKVMVEKGFPGCETVYTAMDNWIGSLGLRKCYVEGTKYFNFPDLSDAVATIREAGGIAILCHPYYYHHQLGMNGIEELIKYFKLCSGYAGAMEVYYKDYSAEQISILERWSEKYDLLPSAGSDYHGQDSTEYLDHHFPIKIYNELYKRSTFLKRKK